MSEMSKEFYRNVFRGVQDSPSFGGCDRSPMTSLTDTLHGTTLNNTPCKRLSLSSTISGGTPDIQGDLSLPSPPVESTIPCILSLKSVCEENSPLSLNQIMRSPRNKENLPTPYYSPSHSHIARYHQTPLREVQNTATRNLSFSPLKQAISPSRREHLSPIKIPTPPDDCDSNSRDSGYSESGQKRDVFNIPRSCAPTRKLNLDMSPRYSPFKSPTEGLKVRFASLKKKSDEDEFLMEFICGVEDIAGEENETSLQFSSLLSAPIQSSQSTTAHFASICPRLPIRRCLSMLDTSTTNLQVNSDIKKSPPKIVSVSAKNLLAQSSFKRPASPSDMMMDPKRPCKRDENTPCIPIAEKVENSHVTFAQKSISQRQFSQPEQPTVNSKENERHKFQRCHSESHVSIMKALNVVSNHNGELTGNFAQTLSLPTIHGGKHPDLKAISIHTMADVLRGKYSSKIGSVKVLDCRYPYEYGGGHVMTAENWHHPKMVYDFLNAQEAPPKIPASDAAPRNILIFHCEFSAERGPRAQRMLREIDRTANKDHYPALHFPEMYLLEGGYKAFYESYPELCAPLSYVKMLDENHMEDLKFFRAKSKSWTVENRQAKCSISRTGPKRLGL